MVINIHKSRPCMVRSTIWCFYLLAYIGFSGFGLVVSILSNDFLPICITAGITAFLVLHLIIFAAYCLFKGNSYIYMDDTKLWQKQYGKIIEIRYSDIEDVMETRPYKTPHRISVCKGEKKITFEKTSKSCKAFMTYCTNVGIREKAKKILEYTGALTCGEKELKRLSFLKDYGFQIQNDSNDRYVMIHFIREDCCLTYHEWRQFGDFEIFICESLDDFKKHQFLRTYNNSYLWENIYPKYKQTRQTKRVSDLDLVEFYLQEQISKQEEAFGIFIHQ